jgi:hypothetical protein
MAAVPEGLPQLALLVSPVSNSWMLLYLQIACVTLAYAILHDSVSDLIAVADLDDVVAERSYALADRGICKIPTIVLDMELSLVVAVEPPLKAAVEATLQEIPGR